MSIVRIGLAETKNFSTGYEAIFGKRKAAAKNTASRSKAAKPKKKSAKKK